ncbi:hypothetical protein DENSPDRAFT_851208 [Dentipellis sp. KUC8613]|nr:hypothetical protein DENSPDRAFT_851208 [Dentipellis sp. KUC8613]
MARTTAKSKKTTSGVAPRKQLGDWTDNSASLAKKIKQVCLDNGEVTDSSRTPASKDNPDADYCNRCNDGGVTLIECDCCRRVHCRDCIKFNLSDEELASCHIEEEQGRQPKPYVLTQGRPLQGFYKCLVDADGRTTRGKPVQSTSVHLADFISSIVTPYFKHNRLKCRIVVRDINFNLGNSAGRKAYAGCVKGLVKALKAMDSSNLFFRQCSSMCWQHSTPHTSSWYNFANVLTFTAPRLQPDHVKPFLLQLMQKHFIHGYPLVNVLPSILSEIPPKFGRHTGVIHLRYSGPNPPCVREPGIQPADPAGSIADQNSSMEPWELSVSATKYQWHSGSIQPWGVYIPDQCPECLCLQQWDFGKPNLNTIQPITVTCRGRKERGAAEGSLEVDAVQPQEASIKKSKHRDRRKAKHEARQKLQCHATDAGEKDPEDSNLVPSGFKWVKPVSEHVQGKWMIMDA